MIYKNFNGGNKDHSLLGFGTMRLPMNEDKTIDFAQAEKTIDKAYAEGVNYYDTAYIYHDGKAEAFIGEVLKKYPRDSYFLADKLPMWLIKEADDMERIFNEQLERCGVEYFDYYLAHSLGKKTVEVMRELNTIAFLEKKKAEGKIRHIGFSFHDDAECLRDVISMFDWEFCQLQLNYADWNRFGAHELYEIATSANLPIIVMEPVRGGMLANPAPAIAEIQKGYAPEKSCASWALRFVASQPNVCLVLSGMSDMSQVEDNLSTFADDTVFLNSEENAIIIKSMNILDNLKSIPCTGCKYCMPCPFGLEIPMIFGTYNNVELFKERYDDYTKRIPEDKRADKCTGCGACMAACPQNIQIPDRMAEVVKFFSKDV